MDDMLNQKREIARYKLQRDHRRMNKYNKKSKEELDAKRFEDIKDQRYRENLSNLHNELNVPKTVDKTVLENALKEKKELDIEKDTIFLKKWD